jgi:4-amino-4-deoxy-L-arabinose transferase-like glycosyltransferase
MIWLRTNWQRLMAFILCIGVIALRIWLLVPAWQFPQRFLEFDSFHYLDLTRSLIYLGKYESVEYLGMDFIRPPGYPIFLIPGVVVGNGNTRWISIYQVLLSFVTAWLLYKIGWEINQPRMGWIAALFYLANPNTVLWSMVILTETLAAFLITAAFFLAIRYFKTKKIWWLLLTGLTLGYATLTRPIIQPLVYIWIVLLIIYFIRDKSISWPAKINPLVVFVLGYFLLVFPWLIRNQVVHNVFSISSIGQSTIEDWMIAKVVAEVEDISRSEAVALISQAPDPTAYSLQLIRDYPGVFIKEQVRGILRTLLGASSANWALLWGGQDIPSTGLLSHLLYPNSDISLLPLLKSGFESQWFLPGFAGIAYDILLYGACIFGLRSLWRFRSNRIILIYSVLSIVTLIYLVVSPFAAGDARFRAPADPLLTLIAGSAWLTKG